MEEKKFEIDWLGRKLIIKTGKLARLASAAVTIQYGETVLLVTAVVSDKQRDGIDFFPLTVDFEERFYAAGKITSARFIKREGRPSEKAILTSRLIDRPIRPLFPKGFRNDVQIMATVLSLDDQNAPDILAMIGASAALMLTGAPFEGPIAAARIGMVDGKLIANPTEEQRFDSKLDLVVAGKSDAIMMVEAGANEVTESEILDAFKLALKEFEPVIELQKKMVKELKIEQKEYKLGGYSKELYKEVEKFLDGKLGKALQHIDNDARHKAVGELEETVLEKFVSEEIEESMVREVFEQLEKDEIKRAIVEEEKRGDGRKLDEVRSIFIDVGLLPRTHGSGLFTRGETQALSTVTLAGPGAAQIIESMDQDFKKSYFHHYNFPPYSTGEAKPLRGLGRRDIGHGALAERALLAVLPEKETFPYTIRVVSEILSSNGSTSMASVCGSTLSLMDAGVPIRKPVAGVAMGLMSDGKVFKVLTDIRGEEDFAGDMDFKVAGTDEGITALQMDMKIQGISIDVLTTALEQAKTGRLFILDKITKVLDKPRAELSPLAPRIYSLAIHPDKIREVIGKGGETINKIIEETGVEIDIEDSGMVHISSKEKDAAEKAMDWIKKLSWTPEEGESIPGKVYLAKITGVRDDLGGFAEFLPGQEGLIHVSQIADRRVEKAGDELKIGDLVPVMLLETDSQGRNNLSMKAAQGLKVGEIGQVPERRPR